MIDVDQYGSPGWWLNGLAVKLHERRQGRSGRYRFTRNQVASSKIRPGLELLDDYLRGDPPLRPDIHTGWAEPFRQFVRMGRLNLAELLVTSTSNRMGIRDFRTAAADDELGDEEARKVMRANQLKLVARDVHDWMLGLGDGYTLVTPPAAEGETALITAESPLECITAHDPATGRRLAGLKMFRDEWDSADWAYLYLSSAVGDNMAGLYVARLDGPTTIFGRTPFRFHDDWSWEEDRFDDIPGGVVPLVRFRNRHGRGEFEPHLDHLDRINDKIFNEWWIGKIQAFRQRAAKNLPEYDEKGNPIDYTGMFTSAPDALWQLPEGADMWESSVVDVGPLVNSIQKELQWLAAAASKPLHTITPDAANGSAEGASLMREEHVEQIGDRRDRAEGSWAETMSLAFLFAGDEQRGDVTQIEPLWGPLERHSLTERSSAAAQLWGKLPAEAIYTDVLQYPPAEVPQLRTLRGRDLLFQAPGQPPARPAGTL